MNNGVGANHVDTRCVQVQDVIASTKSCGYVSHGHHDGEDLCLRFRPKTAQKGGHIN